MSNSTRLTLGRSLMFVASLLLVVASARAEFAVVQLTTNYGTIGGGTAAIGWEFTPARPILITKLGYFDSGFNGLVTSHELGIFSVATESLVTSAVIDAGLNAPIEGPHVAGGGFRYVSVPSVVLTPGTNYIIAATPVGYIDQTASFQPIGNNHQLVTAPDILSIQGRYNFFGPPGLEFPEDEFPNVEFGPSFQFVPVPEPASYALGAFALLALLLVYRNVSSRHVAFVALTLAVGVASTEAQAITIPTVRIGNPGNLNDPADGDQHRVGVQNFGRVDYVYEIGKYEVTVGQYAAFLNAVARTDTYGLYYEGMASNLNIGRIGRSGSPGDYTYNVIGSPNKPVSYVSWGDAVRFANWLHNGQPTGLQDALTTERGAYTLDGANSIQSLGRVSRNAGARWFLPSEDEWYKAAYHKNDGVMDNYWAYPTSTDLTPYSDQPPGSDAPTPSNTANFYNYDGVTNGYNDGYAVTPTVTLNMGLNYVADVGAYTLSSSPYGTFDQGGNLTEWTESVAGAGRALRGGSFHTDSFRLLSSWRDSFVETQNFSTAAGFRVATIPEPSTYVLGALSLLSLFVFRRYKE